MATKNRNTKKETRSIENKQKKPDKGIAVLALILNLIILPGVGSIVGGRTASGIAQLVIFLGSLIVGLMITVITFGIGIIIGLPIMIIGMLGAWIWALITGIQIVQEAD